MDDRSSRTGSIVFGGIDTAKFTGPLITLHSKPEEEDPVLRGQYLFQQLQLANFTTRINGSLDGNYSLVQSANATNTSRLETANMTATLDSGANAIVVPDSWVETLMSQMPINLNLSQKYRAPLTFCDDAEADVSLIFTLQDEPGHSVTIEVPFHELVAPFRKGSSYDKSEPVYEGDRPICMITLSTRVGGDVVLGDPFLRSAYTFYHLDQHTISIAQAANNPKSEHIVAIGKGPVPKLVGTA